MFDCDWVQENVSNTNLREKGSYTAEANLSAGSGLKRLLLRKCNAQMQIHMQVAADDTGILKKP